MVSMCLPSDALSQHLPSYLGFSCLGRGVCLYSCLLHHCSLALSVAAPDFGRGVAPHHRTSALSVAAGALLGFWGSRIILKNFPQFAVIHTVKGFCIVSEAEADFSFWNSLAFLDPVVVGNLISGCSAFSKSTCTSESSWITHY